MALTVVCVKQKQGVYEGNSYDNINIFALNDRPEDSKTVKVLAGPDVELIKIKTQDFMVSLGRNGANGFNTVADLEGAIINPIYNRYGNCVDFTLTQAE